MKADQMQARARHERCEPLHEFQRRHHEVARRCSDLRYVEGDTRMPPFDLAQWREGSTQAFSADDQNPYDYSLTVYDRVH